MTGKPRILIVEDDADIQDFLGLRFKRRFEVVRALTQEEAHAALAKQAFDLVLLDLKLPRTSHDLDPSPDVGVAVLQHIREQKVLHRSGDRSLPVIVMTAHGLDRLFNAEVLSDRGAFDYVRKPFGAEDDDNLESKVEKALLGARAFSKDSIVHLFFNPHEKTVLVEKLAYTGPHFEVLEALRLPFQKNWEAGGSSEGFEGLRGAELAYRWHLSEHAVRQRIRKFRDEVREDFRKRLGRDLYKEDIIENDRSGSGYRLNPMFVRILPTQEMTGIAKI